MKIVLALFIISFNVIAKEFGPPNPAGSILIIYNSQNISHTNENNRTNIKEALQSIAPEGDPRRPSVDVLRVSDGNILGFFDELESQFPEALQRYPKEQVLRNWSQVWDIRIVTNSTGNPIDHPADHFDANLSDPTSDYNLFLDYLSAGGSIYLGGSHTYNSARNREMFKFINHVTGEQLDHLDVKSHGGGSIQHVNTFFDVEEFPVNFNNLEEIAGTDADEPVRFTYVGYYDGIISSATPLIKVGAVPTPTIYMWYPHNMLRVDAGRMILALDKSWIDMWNEGSKAVIQNLYTLMSGYRHYDLYKKFAKEEVDLYDRCSFSLRIKSHEKIFNLENIEIVDTMPKCLEFISSTPEPTSISRSTNGNEVLRWLVPTVNPSDDFIINVEYRAISIDCI